MGRSPGLPCREVHTVWPSRIRAGCWPRSAGRCRQITAAAMSTTPMRTEKKGCRAAAAATSTKVRMVRTAWGRMMTAVENNMYQKISGSTTVQPGSSASSAPKLAAMAVPPRIWA